MFADRTRHQKQDFILALDFECQKSCSSIPFFFNLGLAQLILFLLLFFCLHLCSTPQVLPPACKGIIHQPLKS
ncbi:hypothetical protein L6452_34127 [Arctium lappa]|uniref:Uncharacterized protein n=1 Tax=Arctium lappa TaxID=4217 RepID=A0ACB8YGM1_ARCLA|nr:hypothetical protein L6452_34127 [Arctium lappa]